MEKVRREMQVGEKVGKSRNPVFFQCFEAPEGGKMSKSRLAKAAGAEVAGQTHEGLKIARRCGAKHILK